MATPATTTPSGRVRSTRSTDPEAEGQVERDSRRGRHQGQPAEALGAGVGLAALEDGPAEAAPGPIGADEHRPDPGRLGPRVQQPVVVVPVRGAGIELGPPAPAAAGDDLAARLVDEVGAVLEQARIERGDVDDGARRLGRVVVAGEELERRGAHQRGDPRGVPGPGPTLGRGGPRVYAGSSGGGWAPS